MISKVSDQDIQNLFEKDEVFALIDVREKNEYESGQIFGATNVPRSLLEVRIPVLFPRQDTRIILYSLRDERALLAAKSLESYGYSKVAYLAGGLAAWKGKGLPVVEGTHVIGKAFGEIVAEVRKMQTRISPQELHSWLEKDENLIVIEVRPREEVVQTGSIKGAVNIPGVEIVAKITDYQEEGRKVITTCAGHTRGYISSATLNLMGIKEVYDLDCGTLGWRLAGFELEKGTPLGPQPSMASKQAGQAFAESLGEKQGIPVIDGNELQEMLDNPEAPPTYLLDVRTKEEYELIGRIPGSVMIPGGQAIQNSDDTVAIHGANIVFICDDGTRSRITAYWYKETGYEKVYVLDGGLNGWTKQGKKLVRGKSQFTPLGFPEIANAVEKIEPTAVKKILEASSDLYILDVADSRSFKSGHLAGAHWVPRARLEKGVGQVVPDKKSHVLVTCTDGLNALYASSTLQELGYKRVYALKGGKIAWKNSGFTLTEGLDGIEPDDWFVTLSEYNLEEAKNYFAWEDNMIHLPEYMDFFRKKGKL